MNVTQQGLRRFAFDLNGRTILVTGASTGIGVGFARVLAASGASVVLAARRIKLLECVRDEIVAAGGKALAVTLDVADEASTIAAYDAAERAFGPVDSVIANAGAGMGGLALDADVDYLARTLDINIRGVFLTAREGARRMLAAGSTERHHGRIVLVSSITAHHVTPALATYSATKAAVNQLGKVLAREWANKGINVNVLCPGYMETEMTDAWFGGEGGKKQPGKFPRKRLMETDALDPMILYLASDASEQVTGSVFTVDDGQSL